MNKNLEYFKGDELAAQVFEAKYALRDKDDNILENTPDDMHKRLAKELARIEAKYPNPINEESIYHLIKDFKYIVPQGRPMFGIGNNNACTSISNCYLIPPTKDSYAHISKTDQELIQISKRGGGVGLNISNLRPFGSTTSNSGKGIVGSTSYMDRFSYTAGEVAQGNRRAALMIGMRSNHPDIFKFITKKLDKKSVTNANISVFVEDDLIERVKNDDNYNLVFNNKVYETVKAKKVLTCIADTAWKSAEPGILFLNRIRKESPADCYSHLGFRTEGTNPCQPEFATVLTPNGIKLFKDINKGDLIWSSEGWTKIVNKQSSGIQDVYNFKTKAGYFIGTKDHKIIENGKKVKVSLAKSIDNLSGEFVSVYNFNPELVMDGLVLGNGNYHKKSEKIYLHINKNDNDYFKNDTNSINNLILKRIPEIKSRAYEIKTSIRSEELPVEHKRFIPNRFIFSNNNKNIRSILRGLFSTNGSIIDDRIVFKSSSIKMIEDVQILLSSVGIRSYYTVNKCDKKVLKNSEYTYKESYNLNICKDRLRFYNTIGFIQDYKTAELEGILRNPCNSAKNSYGIISKEYLGKHEVFDITVDNNSHTYWTGGVNVSNCGEIPLSPYSSCLLLCINLSNYVIDEFKQSARINYSLLSYHAYLAQKLLDDMVDLEIEKVSTIINKINKDINNILDNDENEDPSVYDTELNLWRNVLRCLKQARRTGLGITGVADMLAKMGLKYDSDEAIYVVGEVSKNIANFSYMSSIDMAESRGCFEVFDYNLEKNNPFINRVLYNLNNKYKEKYFKYGRRNIANLTIPPAGSVSIMTQTTSGIEPLFLPYYIRKRRVEDKKLATIIDSNGIMFQEYKVVHKPLNDWYINSKHYKIQKKLNGYESLYEIVNDNIDLFYKIFEKSPYANSTYDKIDPLKKIDIIGSAQTWIDHAISNTLNLPSTTTSEDVLNMYIRAYDKGLKGLTVYVDGSLDAVLNSANAEKGSNESSFNQVSAPKRPKELLAKLEKIKSKGIEYAVVVGFLENKPYEVFAFATKDIPGINNCEGKIIKIKKGQYDFSSNNLYIPNIQEDYNCQEERAVNLSTSMLLRTGAYPKFVCKTLKKINPTINSFTSAISRILSKYIIEDEVKPEVCPNCGASIVKEGGCEHCSSCEYSKCNFIKIIS